MKPSNGKKKKRSKKKIDPILSDGRDIRVLPVKYTFTVMSNHPDKRRQYFEDLNTELETENLEYEERIEYLKTHLIDERNQKTRYIKAADKMSKLRSKVQKNLDLEKKKKRVKKQREGISRNLENFVDKKIQKNREIKRIKRKRKMDLNQSKLEIKLEKQEKYNRIMSIKRQAKEELTRKIQDDLSQKRKIKEEKKRIKEVNRKVKQQLKHFQHKMSKRTALMKKLIKIKHQIDKTTPFNVSTKKINKNQLNEEEILDHFIESNMAIKNMAKRLKKMRKSGHIRKGSHFSKRDLQKKYKMLMGSSRSISNMNGLPLRKRKQLPRLGARTPSTFQVNSAQRSPLGGSQFGFGMKRYGNKSYQDLLGLSLNPGRLETMAGQEIDWEQMNWDQMNQGGHDRPLNRYNKDPQMDSHNFEIPISAIPRDWNHLNSSGSNSNNISLPIQFMSPGMKSDAPMSSRHRPTKTSGSNFYRQQQRHTADPNARPNKKSKHQNRALTRSTRGIQTEHNRGFSESGGWLKNSQKTRKKGGFRGNQSGFIGARTRAGSNLENSKKNLFSQSMIIGGRKKKRKKRKKFEETLLEELMQPKQRKADEFADFSNVSMILKPKKKDREEEEDKVDVGASLIEMRQNMERFKTMQTEKLRAQSQIIERTCAITKQGGREIEKMARKNPNRAIFRKATYETDEGKPNQARTNLKKMKSYKDLDKYKEIKPLEKIRSYKDIKGFMDKSREKHRDQQGRAQLNLDLNSGNNSRVGQQGIRRESQPRFAGNYSPIRRPKLHQGDFISQHNKNKSYNIGAARAHQTDNPMSQRLNNSHQDPRMLRSIPYRNSPSSYNQTEKNLIFEGASSGDEATPRPPRYPENREEVEKRKFTFSMKLGNGLRNPNGLLDMNKIRSNFLGNDNIHKEILKGIEENFGEEDMETEQAERRMTGKFGENLLDSGPGIALKRGKKKKPRGTAKKKKGKSKRNLTGLTNISNLVPKTKKGKKGKGKGKKKKKGKLNRDKINKEVVLSRYGVPMVKDSAKNARLITTKPKKTQSSRANLITGKKKTKKKKNKKSAKNEKKVRDSVTMKKKSEKRGKLLAQSFLNSSNIMSVSDLDLHKSKRRRKKKIQGKDSVKIRSKRNTAKSRRSTIKSYKLGESNNMILGPHLLHSKTRNRVTSTRLINAPRLSTKRPPVRNRNRKSTNKFQNSKKRKKNKYFDEELIQKLRDEASSDEEPNSSGMSGVQLDISEIKSANRGIKLKEDKSGINLNYSGDSQDFIDGNISERFMSNSSQKVDLQRRESKVSAFGHLGEANLHFDLYEQKNDDIKRRQTVGNQNPKLKKRPPAPIQKMNRSGYYGEYDKRAKQVGSVERPKPTKMGQSMGHFANLKNDSHGFERRKREFIQARNKMKSKDLDPHTNDWNTNAESSQNPRSSENQNNDSDLMEQHDLEEPDFEDFKNQTKNLLSNQRDITESSQNYENEYKSPHTRKGSKFGIKNSLKLEDSNYSGVRESVGNRLGQTTNHAAESKTKLSRTKKKETKHHMKMLMQNLQQGLKKIEKKGGLTGESKHNTNPIAKNQDDVKNFVYDTETQEQIKTLLKYSEHLKDFLEKSDPPTPQKDSTPEQRSTPSRGVIGKLKQVDSLQSSPHPQKNLVFTLGKGGDMRGFKRSKMDEYGMSSSERRKMTDDSLKNQHKGSHFGPESKSSRGGHDLGDPNRESQVIRARQFQGEQEKYLSGQSFEEFNRVIRTGERKDTDKTEENLSVRRNSFNQKRKTSSFQNMDGRQKKRFSGGSNEHKVDMTGNMFRKKNSLAMEDSSTNLNQSFRSMRPEKTRDSSQNKRKLKKPSDNKSWTQNEFE